jgi:hypothetical protein
MASFGATDRQGPISGRNPNRRLVERRFIRWCIGLQLDGLIDAVQGSLFREQHGQ